MELVNYDYANGLNEKKFTINHTYLLLYFGYLIKIIV